MVGWKIGPTFQSEIAAAGIEFKSWGYSIGTGEITFAAEVPQATRDAIAAVYAAHNPELQTDPPTLPYPLFPFARP